MTIFRMGDGPSKRRFEWPLKRVVSWFLLYFALIFWAALFLMPR
jgi:hypothetical protein